MKYLSIFEYTTGILYTVENPDCDDYDEFIQSNYNLKESEYHYMTHDLISINI